MKRISSLQLVLLAVLMVSAVSCGLPMGATGDYYEDAPARGHVYYGNPYNSGYNTVIVERDPFTGRYYQVNPRVYGGVYARPAYPSNSRRYNNRSYNNNTRNNAPRNSTPRNNGNYRYNPRVQEQTPAQKQQLEKERAAAKESILGKKRN